MKKICGLILAVVMVLSLAACGSQGKPEDVVTTFCEAMKNFDSESASSCFADGVVPPDLSVDSEDLGEEMGSEEIVQYLKDCAGKMTYKVNAAQVDGDKATVLVNITYTDISPVVTQAMGDYIAKAFEMAMSEGGEVDEAEAQQIFADILMESSKNVEAQSAAIDVTFDCEKVNGEWKLSQMSDDTLNSLFSVLSSNFLSAIEGVVSSVG